MQTQKNLYSALAGALLLTSGCATYNKTKNYVKGGETYAHNAADDLLANQFSDRDFNTSRSEVRMPHGIYIFGKFKPDDEIIIDGKRVPADQLFPYWGLPKDQMTEYVTPGRKEAHFGRDDGLGSVFTKAEIEKLGTSRRFDPQELPTRAEVGNVGESRFRVPGINFENRDDRKDGLGYVVYNAGKTRGTNGIPTQFLTVNPTFGLDNEKKVIKVFGIHFMERKKIFIPSLKYGVTKDNFVDTEVFWRDVTP